MTDNDAILCQTEIRDWRIAEDSIEDLTGRQTEDWLVEASHSTYHGLTLTLKAPDGSDRMIDIEIDQGNVVVRSYRGDEPDAKMIVAADATYVSSCAEVGLMGRKIIRYEPEDADFHSGEVPANMGSLATEIVATGEKFQASLEWIGEGEDGDYRPDDPNDRLILRFDVSQKGDDGKWEDVPDSSYCMQLDARLPRPIRELAANLVLKAVEEAHAAGLSIKRVCERLSWMDEDAAKAGDTAPFLKTELVTAAE
ncbi:hypothetical protein [Microvirga sp. VF16]|uniref:hypothetical protein n=1 Tax=Microvirga sp. VF16 TaxID=2807101 RepID=UPI00193DEFE1|nr:hypothetical protein [Microvirga sp. VF16]QRM34779.1 hypothetical protein JO965_41690 [Microvirga sp. VF16]